MTSYCHETQGKRIYVYGKPLAGLGQVYVECVECGAEFADADNVGNLPLHDKKG